VSRAGAARAGRVVSERLVARIADLSKGVGETFTVSPDNRHIAYARVVGGLFGGKLSVMVDEQEVGRYDGLLPGSLVFSPDGRRLAPAGLRGGKRVVAVDGKETTGHGRVSRHFVFSPDSRRLAYVVGAAERKWSVIVDGQSGTPHDGIGSGNVRFSPDGRRLGYAAMEAGKWFVVIDGQDGGATTESLIPLSSLSRTVERLAIPPRWPASRSPLSASNTMARTRVSVRSCSARMGNASGSPPSMPGCP